MNIKRRKRKKRTRRVSLRKKHKLLGNTKEEK